MNLQYPTLFFFISHLHVSKKLIGSIPCSLGIQHFNIPLWERKYFILKIKCFLKYLDYTFITLF